MEKVTLWMYPYMPSLISESTVKIREKEKVKTNRARNDALLQICILTKQWPQALLVAFSQPLPVGPSGQLYNFQCSVHLKNACHVPGTVLCMGWWFGSEENRHNSHPHLWLYFSGKKQMINMIDKIIVHLFPPFGPYLCVFISILIA